MTTPTQPLDIGKLKERLRRMKTEHRVLHLFGGAISVPDEDETRQVPVNPDGEDAIAAIESLIAKAERVDALEAALTRAGDSLEDARDALDFAYHRTRSADDLAAKVIADIECGHARNALSPTPTEDQHG